MESSLTPILQSIGESKLFDAMTKIHGIIKERGKISIEDASELLVRAREELDDEIDELLQKAGIDEEITLGNIGSLLVQFFPKGLTAAQVKIIRTEIARLTKTQASKPITLNLAGIGLETDGLPVDKLDILIKASAGIEVTMQPHAVPPDSGTSEPDPSLVRTAIKGVLAGELKVKGAFEALALKLLSKGDYRHELGYYHQVSEGATLGREGLRGLSYLGSHARLDIRALKHLMSRSEQPVSAVEFVADQNWVFNSEMMFGKDIRLGEGIPAELDFKYSLKMQKRGTFRYLITHEENRIRVRIAAEKSSTESERSGVTAEIDFTKLAQDLYPKLSNSLNRLNDKLIELLPSGEVVKDTLIDKINEGLDGFPYKAELLAVLGLGPGAETLEERINTRLAELINAAPTLWNDKTEKNATRILEDVMARLSLPEGDIRVKLVGSLKKKLAEALEKFDGIIRDKIRSSFENSDELARLNQAVVGLFSQGEKVVSLLEKGEQAIDKALAKIREHLGDYQAFLGNFIERVESSQSSQLRIALESSFESRSSTEADVDLRFDPDHADSQLLFRQLLTGNVEAVFRKAMEAGDSGAAEVVSGKLETYDSLLRKSSLNVQLLGFELDSNVTRLADVKFVESADGTILITTRHQYSAIRKTLIDSRKFDLFNLVELSNLKSTGKCTLSLSLYKEDEGLTQTRFKHYLRAAKRLKIIKEIDQAAIKNVVKQARGAERFRILLRTILTAKQIETLISHGEPEFDGDLSDLMQAICNPDASEAPVRPRQALAVESEWRAYEALSIAIYFAMKTGQYKGTVQNINAFLDLAEPPEDYVVRKNGKAFYRYGRILRDFDRIIDVTTEGDVADIEGGLSLASRGETWLKARRKAVAALRDVYLPGLWALYHSGKFNWSRKRILQCQDALSEAIASWFYNDDDLQAAFSFSDDMHPLTASLARTILAIAGEDSDTPPVFQVEVQTLTDAGEVDKRYPL